MLVSLGSGGGVPDVSDKVSLGGVVDPSSLLPGKVDPPGLGGGASLEAGPGTLGVDAGGWLDVVDGTPLSVGDGCPEGVEPSDPADSGDSLRALGAGDPLGGGKGSVTELSSLAPLGVVSEPVDDGPAEGVGLVDPADGGEPVEADGKVDGTSVEEVSTPELGWPDVGDVSLLGGKDSGDVLGALDSPSLVGDGWELATGLVDVGLSLDGGSALAESGDAELGGTSLDPAEGALLGVVEDCPDSLPAIDGPSELAGDVLSLVRLSLLGPDAEDTVLVSEGGAEPELPPLDGSAELAADEPPLADDVWLSDDGGLSPLETWLEVADEISECGDDDIPDGDTEDGCELPEDAGDGELES